MRVCVCVCGRSCVSPPSPEASLILDQIIILEPVFDIYLVSNIQVSAKKLNNEEKKVGCSEGANAT